MVLEQLKRLFRRGTPIPPEQAKLRLKALRARLAKNRADAKRVYSELQKIKNLDPERKTERKARLKQLTDEKREITREMKQVRPWASEE